jgi:hypothetical protein
MVFLKEAGWELNVLLNVHHGEAQDTIQFLEYLFIMALILIIFT